MGGEEEDDCPDRLELVVDDTVEAVCRGSDENEEENRFDDALAPSVEWSRCVADVLSGF